MTLVDVAPPQGIELDDHTTALVERLAERWGLPVEETVLIAVLQEWRRIGEDPDQRDDLERFEKRLQVVKERPRRLGRSLGDLEAEDYDSTGQPI